MPQRFKVRSSLSMVASLGVHIGAFALLLDVEARDGPGRIYEFAVAEVPEPEEPPEPEPEAKEEPEPEPEPEPTRRRPPPPQPVAEAPVEDEPVEDEPPPRFELPPDQIAVGSGSGVAVHVGYSKGVPPAAGKKESEGKGSRPKDTKTAPDAPAWKPRNELHIRRLPDPVEVPEIQCPAVREMGITGTVILKVQVKSDGTVRKVRVVKGVGHGCDQVAVKALRRARFKPAIATNGQPADYELRYEYVFELDD